MSRGTGGGSSPRADSKPGRAERGRRNPGKERGRVDPGGGGGVGCGVAVVGSEGSARPRLARPWKKRDSSA